MKNKNKKVKVFVGKSKKTKEDKALKKNDRERVLFIYTSLHDTFPKNKINLILDSHIVHIFSINHFV